VSSTKTSPELADGPAVVAGVFPDAPVRVVGVDDRCPVPGTPASAPANAVAKRRDQWQRGRLCGRLAAQLCGRSVDVISTDPDGAPVWPAGFVGSITHCDGFAAAAVASDPGVAAVGVDAEPDRPLPGGVIDRIATPSELESQPDGLPPRALFCAKESAFKALSSWRGMRPGAKDLVARAGDDGTLRVDLVDGVAQDVSLSGGWTTMPNGVIVVGAAVLTR
jgi:4'-phosphopantetheinyl transferase EntD